MTNGVAGELEQLLYREATLLDDRRYDEWLGLLTADIVYWIPNFSEDGERSEAGVIVYERMEGLQARVARAGHARSPIQRPPARTRHLITNIVATIGGSDGAEVTSNLLVYIAHERRVSHHAAKVNHKVRKEDGAWRIAEKKIFLIDNDQPLSPLPIL